MWVTLPSAYLEIACFGIVVEPLQYIVTVNLITNETIASVKLYPDKGDKEIVGVFKSFSEARQACAEHYSNKFPPVLQ